jgi:hypothetical protein
MTLRERCKLTREVRVERPKRERERGRRREGERERGREGDVRMCVSKK